MKLLKIVGAVALLSAVCTLEVNADTLAINAKSVSTSLLGAGHEAIPMFSSVPEPSDWAWIPVVAVVAVIAFRRFRSQPAN